MASAPAGITNVVDPFASVRDDDVYPPPLRITVPVPFAEPPHTSGRAANRADRWRRAEQGTMVPETVTETESDCAVVTLEVAGITVTVGATAVEEAGVPLMA